MARLSDFPDWEKALMDWDIMSGMSTTSANPLLSSTGTAEKEIAPGFMDPGIDKVVMNLLTQAELEPAALATDNPLFPNLDADTPALAPGSSHDPIPQIQEYHTSTSGLGVPERPEDVSSGLFILDELHEGGTKYIMWEASEEELNNIEGLGAYPDLEGSTLPEMITTDEGAIVANPGTSQQVQLNEAAADPERSTTPVEKKSRRKRKSTPKKPKLHESSDVNDDRVKRAKYAHKYRQGKANQTSEELNDLKSQLQEERALRCQLETTNQELQQQIKALQENEALSSEKTVKLLSHAVAAFRECNPNVTIICSRLGFANAPEVDKAELRDIVKRVGLPQRCHTMIFDLNESRDQLVVNNLPN